MQSFTARVSEHQLIAGSFQYLHLELLKPDRIEFQAGQYLILTIDSAKGIRRDYSIGSQPEINHAIELLVDVKPQGPGSTYLKNLKIGDQVEFVAPFGNFVVAENCLKRSDLAAARSDLNKSHQLLFAATGSGISPIRSMILDLFLTKKYQGSIRLWWGMRRQEDCFWIEDFDNLEKEYPNFKWDLVLSNPPSDWPLHSGHVTKHVLDYVQNVAKGQGPRAKGQTNSGFPLAFSPKPLALDACFYLCGNKFMIEEISTKLEEFGINREHIHTEKFF